MLFGLSLDVIKAKGISNELMKIFFSLSGLDPLILIMCTSIIAR